MAVVNPVIEQKALATVRALARRAHVRAAYLFGSQITGTADQWSDIDIAVFIDEAADWDLEQRVRACVDAQSEVSNDVELHLFPTSSYENPPRASFAQYVIQHGQRLEI